MTIPDPMAEIRASFFIECEELLEALQDGLTQLDSGDAHDETINVCFRAVHSMKGGAGAFGLDDLVRFAHRYETVMDEVRAGRLTPDHDAVLLFMRSADVLSDIVRNSRDGVPTDPDAVDPTLRELEGLVGGVDDEAEADVVDFQPMTLDISLPDAPDDSDVSVFDVDFAPEPELFRSGNEPLHLIRALSELGDATVVLDRSKVPALQDLDPDCACLSWRITLATDRDRAEVEEVFEFVEGLCGLKIAAPEPVPAMEIPTLPSISERPDALADSASKKPAKTLAEGTGDILPRLTLTDAATESPGHDEFAEKTFSGIPLPTPRHEKPSIGATMPPPQPNTKPPDAGKKTTVRVDLERIERLVNLVGELVINQAMLSQSVAQAGLPATSPVAQGLEEFMQLTRDIQDSVMMIRAQPVKSLFQRMARIVRESSAGLGKSVRFVTKGDTTEVDKTVIERLADPLTHMIRNAVDHGLEDSETRLAAGKAPEGCITLSAAHRSGRVVIEVTDDGGGIDRDRVRAIAENRGLIEPGTPLSDSEIDDLLFLPGFSTVSQVSDLSGRGVGMDVVRKAIQDLGGRVGITSKTGNGTCFSISLPLTLAVLDGMVVNSAGESLVMPINAIAETMAFRNEDVRPLGPDSQVLRIRDSFVPLLDLGVELGFRSPRETYEGSVVLLVADENEAQGALIVDTIHDQRQVVIKGLEESYGRVPGIAAATILGDGQVALILDPADLMANAVGRTRPISHALQATG